jgi:hypothetical protein
MASKFVNTNYEYLHEEHPGGLFDEVEALKLMAQRLERLGHADDAASDTREVIRVIQQAEREIRRLSKRLRGVWREVGWMDAYANRNKGDDVHVKEELTKYRDIQ